LEDMQTLQKTQTGGGVEQEVSPVELAQQIAILQHQLEGLVANEKSRAILDPQHFIQHYTQLQTDLSSKLIAELNAVKSLPTSSSIAPSVASSSSTTPSPNPKTVTYELYYTPDQAKYIQISKLVDIERRVASVEALVGQPTGGPSLTSTVTELRDKITLLDAGRLDGVQQRMKALLPQLEAAAAAGTAAGRAQTSDPKSGAAVNTTPATEKKINDLYEVMNRWDLVSQQLPALVSRLSALHSLHEESLNFSTTLSKLETEQQAMSSLLKDNLNLLGKVDTSFKENMNIIQKNVTTLEERFKNLAK